MKPDSRRYESRGELRSVVFDFAHGLCEWPGCSERATELAHIVSTGMGGDPQHRRDTVDNTFAACPSHARISDGLPPPGGGYADRNAEYAKVPGSSPFGISPAADADTYRTRQVMQAFAKWIRQQRNPGGEM